jgi:hypothetical protein
MTDLFFCTAPTSLMRMGFAIACLERWRLEPSVRVTILTADYEEHIEWFTPWERMCPYMRLGPLAEFQRQRRIYADGAAQSDPYILADDDCLLPADFDLPFALELASVQSDFRILSTWPANATIHKWNPQDYRPVETLELLEHVSVGGIRICRKGMLAEWPAQDGPGYDGTQCEAIRAEGGRVGYLKNFPHLHLGEGRAYSTVWK